MPPADMARMRACAPGRSPALASYLGSSHVFDRAIATFAEAYADQNERDHAALLHAIAIGRVQAEPEL
jgi:uncharacterized protein DUF2252